MKLIKNIVAFDLKDTLIRFYLPMICAVSFAVLSIITNHDEYLLHARWPTILYSFFYASIVAKLIAESYHWKWFKTILFSFLPLIAILALSSYIDFMFLVPGLILLLPTAPYLFKKVETNTCSYYSRILAMRYFFAFVITLILFCGLFVALNSFSYLFGIEYSNVYTDVWIIIAAMLSPFYFLSGFPKNFNETKEVSDYPSVMKFIVTYVLSPLIIIYLLILYLYAAKILLQWELPKGDLAYIVIGFGVIGIATHLFAYPLRDSGNLLLKFICRYFYLLLLIPIILLFMAIGIRVNQYGITEQRYAILIVAIWFLCSVFYSCFFKTQQHKLILLTISLLLIFSSFGPWGAVNVSSNSQVYRLHTLLEKYQFFYNGKVSPSGEKISVSDRQNITSIIDYLIRIDKINKISTWFADDSYLNTESDNLSTGTIMHDMGIQPVDPVILDWREL